MFQRKFNKNSTCTVKITKHWKKLWNTQINIKTALFLDWKTSYCQHTFNKAIIAKFLSALFYRNGQVEPKIHTELQKISNNLEKEEQSWMTYTCQFQKTYYKSIGFETVWNQQKDIHRDDRLELRVQK